MDYSSANWQDAQTYADFLTDIKSKSRQEGTEHYARHKAIINTKQYVYALKMSDIRLIAKQILKGDYDGFLKAAKNNSYEETIIQGIVIAQERDIEKQIQYLKSWIKNIDNWSTCDSVISAMKVLGKSKNKADYFDWFYGLCFSESEFVSRFGIVSIMCYYLEREYLSRVLEMCEKVSSDAYYVKMAVAWLISYLFVKFKSETYTLLERRVLDKFTQNKAISKCRDSYRVLSADKEKLINYRIK